MNNNSTGNIIALTKELSYVEPLLMHNNPDYKFVYYEDTESCFDAVINKDVHMAIQSNFRTSYLMQKPEYADKLTEISDHDYNIKYFWLLPTDKIC